MASIKPLFFFHDFFAKTFYSLVRLTTLSRKVIMTKNRINTPCLKLITLFFILHLLLRGPSLSFKCQLYLRAFSILRALSVIHSLFGTLLITGRGLIVVLLSIILFLFIIGFLICVLLVSSRPTFRPFLIHADP